METRFVLPLTVATALHALVLFGGKWQHASPLGPVAKTLSEVYFVPVPIDLHPPEEQHEEIVAQAALKKGDPEAFRPHLPEEPNSRIPVFEQPQQPSRPVPTKIVHSISKEQLGSVSGVEGVEWAGGSVVPFDLLDETPRTRSQVAPAYPATERNSGITGEVLVEFTVDESGRVSSARVVRSSHGAFEAPTLRAVEKWRFEPGKKNGRPVCFRMMAPVVFSLND